MPNSTVDLDEGLGDLCIPLSDDEKDVPRNLNGRNQVDQHLFSGWGNIWKGVRDFDESLLIQRLQILDLPTKYGDAYEWDGNDGCLIKQETKKPCTTLQEIFKRTRFTDVLISEPLSLHVIEKRCVSFTAGGYTMTKLVLSDRTGCCWFIMFNDTIVSVYDQLQIGNVLVATGLKFRNNDRRKDTFVEKLTLRMENVFSMETKLNMFEYKRMFVVDTGVFKCPEPFYPAKGIWIPTELWNEDCQRYLFPLSESAIDIIGVICYVSSIMRSRKVDNKHASLANVDFNCYRWIQLIDRKSMKPLTIKLHLNNLSWNNQAEIVPGCAAIFTHMTGIEYDSNYLEFYLESTWYTKVHVNRKIINGYLNHMPKVYRATCKHIVAVKACELIFKNKNIKWSAGGFPYLRIVNSPVLKRMIGESNDRFKIVELARREVLRLNVKGYIYRVQVVTCDNDNNVHYKLLWSDPYFPYLSHYGKEDDSCIDTFIPDPKKYWFAYRRELPPPLEVENNAEELFVTYEKNQNRYKKMLSPLLMPSKTNPEADCQLRDLPVNPNKYFVLWVADPEKKVLISAMWTSRSFEEMESYLKENVMLSQKPAERTANRTICDKEDLRVDSVFVFNVLQIESKGPCASENIQVDLMDVFFDGRDDL